MECVHEEDDVAKYNRDLALRPIKKRKLIEDDELQQQQDHQVATLTAISIECFLCISNRLGAKEIDRLYGCGNKRMQFVMVNGGVTGMHYSKLLEIKPTPTTFTRFKHVKVIETSTQTPSSDLIEDVAWIRTLPHNLERLYCLGAQSITTPHLSSLPQSLTILDIFNKINRSDLGVLPRTLTKLRVSLAYDYNCALYTKDSLEASATTVDKFPPHLLSLKLSGAYRRSNFNVRILDLPRQLERLTLLGCMVGDFAALPSTLTKLTYNDHLNDNEFVKLPNNITRLYLSSNGVLSHGFTHFNCLRVLNIGGGMPTDQDLALLPKTLENLRINDASMITEDGYRNMPVGLKCLNLSRLDSIATLSVLLPRGLTRLSLYGDLTPFNATATCLPPNLKQLTLSTSICSSISINCFRHLPRALERLYINTLNVDTETNFEEHVAHLPPRLCYVTYTIYNLTVVHCRGLDQALLKRGIHVVDSDNCDEMI